MTGYLLDTNHLSEAIRQISHIRDRIRLTHRKGIRLGTCVNVVCELEAGIQHLKTPENYRRRLRELLRNVRLWPIDFEMARLYGEIFFELQNMGRVLDHVDMLLGVLARKLDLTLLTSDRDFEALPDIRTENWLQ
jgi:predicted nucleic acid-binding protein